MKNPIGTTFKKENIFLATVDCPMERDEVDSILKDRGCDLSTITDGGKLLDITAASFTQQEFDLFYKDENGYTRFLMEENETFVGDGSDGKGKLYKQLDEFLYFFHAWNDIDDSFVQPFAEVISCIFSMFREAKIVKRFTST